MPRPKGSPNVVTAAARDAFQVLLDGKVDQLGAWIDQVAVDDPQRAFAMVMHLASFCVPKPKPEDPPPPPHPGITVRFSNGHRCLQCGHDPDNNLTITKTLESFPGGA
jgi:hypothetical protein